MPFQIDLFPTSNTRHESAPGKLQLKSGTLSENEYASETREGELCLEGILLDFKKFREITYRFPHIDDTPCTESHLTGQHNYFQIYTEFLIPLRAVFSINGSL